MTYGRYLPVALPRWELRLSYAVWIFHSLAAFVISYRVCSGPISQWTGHWFRDSDFIPEWRADGSDSEWLYYKRTIRDLVFGYAVHSTVFHLSYRFLDKNQARLVQIACGLALHVAVTSVSCIVVLSVFATFTIAVSTVWRQQIVAWVLCIAFILQATEYVPFTHMDFRYYREFNMYLYGAIKILNVCITLSRRRDRPFDIDWLLEILQYMLYLPYSMALIVIYEDFSGQIAKRTEREAGATTYGVRDNAFFALRLLFWAFFFEALIHFIPVNSLFASPFTLISGLNGYELSSIAYVVGQYFHLKYVVIFGVPSLFARIDGLTPPPPPICISRVSRYSRMWRHFDAGLYSFLKNQVYVPILSHPRLTGIGRPLALVAAFLIVVAWHGSQRHFVCWVCLSAFELIVERIGVILWDTQRFQSVRSRIGDLWMRRAIALSMLTTVIPGIFGVFFFLGNEGVGETIFVKVLWRGMIECAQLNIGLVDGVPTAGMVFLHLIVLGYFFNHVCLELEYSNRMKKAHDKGE